MANTGDASVVSWSWSVAGADSWTDLGNGHINVVWNDANKGQVTVTVTTSDGACCSVTRNVRLIDKPEAGATTVPAYRIDGNGNKVVYVCEGADVEFLDQSVSGDKDIVGYLWQAENTSAATRNFTLRRL